MFKTYEDGAGLSKNGGTRVYYSDFTVWWYVFHLHGLEFYIRYSSKRKEYTYRINGDINYNKDEFKEEVMKYSTKLGQLY